MKKLTAIFVALFVGVFVIGFATAPRTIAHEGEEHADEAAAAVHEAEVDDSEEATEAETGPYAYVAQSGDSYTKMARKAVQTFGILNDVDLSQAQIIYVETKLTQEAGTPELNVGESVKVDETAVRAVIDMAKELDAATIAQWDYYVQFVDFNTDAVGQVTE